MRTFGTKRKTDGAGDAALAGRLIIVTGASSGIGYGVTRRLAQAEGARVVAVARRRVFRIEALAAQVREQSGEERIFPMMTDMADRAQAEAVVQQVEEQFGRIDGFVHAVNRALKLGALDVSDHEFDLTMQVNVKSALYGVQAVVPALRRQGAGGIVVYNPTPRETAEFVASEAVYTAAAHALSALTAGWTRQLDGSGVGVREVAPSPDGDGSEAVLSRSGAAHDALLVAALRETLASPTPVSAAPPRASLFQFRPPQEPRPPQESRPSQEPRAPQILRSHGGLVLTEF
jgi:NAD(P)-dependent dehydrogenase (short-subunit alcohol dehydrogenase family)